jgi:hypothetical protein
MRFDVEEMALYAGVSDYISLMKPVKVVLQAYHIILYRIKSNQIDESNLLSFIHLFVRSYGWLVVYIL